MPTPAAQKRPSFGSSVPARTGGVRAHSADTAGFDKLGSVGTHREPVPVLLDLLPSTPPPLACPTGPANRDTLGGAAWAATTGAPAERCSSASARSAWV